MGRCCFGKKYLKKLLIVFNVYYWFSGPACLGLGIWFLLITRQVQPSLDPTQFIVSSYLMIGSGGAIIVYGVIGCLAIFNENRGLLGFYSVLLFSSFAAQLASCLKLFLLYDTIESQVTYNLDISIRYKYGVDLDVTTKLDNLQEKFLCCGVNNFTDWQYQQINNRNLTGFGFGLYPESCCVQNISHPCNLTTPSDLELHLFNRGCSEPVSFLIKRFCEIFGWSTFSMSAMQIIGGVLVYCFRTAIT